MAVGRRRGFSAEERSGRGNGVHGPLGRSETVMRAGRSLSGVVLSISPEALDVQRGTPSPTRPAPRQPPQLTESQHVLDPAVRLRQPFAFGVGRTTLRLRQLLGHAIRDTVRRGTASASPPGPGHIPVNAPLLQVLGPARCSTPRRPAPSPAARHTSPAPRRAPPATRPGRSRSPSPPSPPPTGAPRPPPPARTAPFAARLHDREVALRVRPYPRLYATALRVPVLSRCRPRASSAARAAASRAPRGSPPSRRRTPPEVIAAKRASSASVRLAQQRLDLARQALFLFLHPVVAHRLALARVRTHLRPVDRQLPQARQTQLPRQTATPRCRRRNSHSVRCCGLPAASTRNPTSSFLPSRTRTAIRGSYGALRRPSYGA